MSRFVRSILALTALSVSVTVAMANSIPSPLFPPDPWEEEGGNSVAANAIPSPLFPPDPWEEEGGNN